jgi:hypothetical protein
LKSRSSDFSLYYVESSASTASKTSTRITNHGYLLVGAHSPAGCVIRRRRQRDVLQHHQPITTGKTGAAVQQIIAVSPRTAKISLPFAPSITHGKEKAHNNI